LFALEILTFVAELAGVALAGIGFLIVRPYVILFWSAAYLDAVETGLTTKGVARLAKKNEEEEE